MQVDNVVALVELRVNSKSTLGLFDCYQTENALNIRNEPTPAGWLIPEGEFQDLDILCGRSPLQLSIKLVRRSDRKCTILCEAAKVFCELPVDIAVEDLAGEIEAVYIDLVEHPRWQFLNWEETRYHIQLVGLHWLQMPDVISWRTAISACEKGKQWEYAHVLLHEV